METLLRCLRDTAHNAELWAEVRILTRGLKLLSQIETILNRIWTYHSSDGLGAEKALTGMTRVILVEVP